MTKNDYWLRLTTFEKRLVLINLWLIRERTPEEIMTQYIEPLMLSERAISADMIPDHIFALDTTRLEREIKHNGGVAKWIG